MLPGRASDAGPDSRKCCPSCGSSKWAVLADCHDCGRPICSECPGVTVDTAGMRTKIRCHDCEIDRQRELYTGEVDDDLPHASDCAHWAGETCDCVTHMDTCDCRFTGDQADASVCRLHQVAARVRHANIPEWRPISHFFVALNVWGVEITFHVSVAITLVALAVLVVFWAGAVPHCPF